MFVFFCSNFNKTTWSLTKLCMDTFTDDNKLISINKSVAANENMIPSLIALHALSGYDSAPMIFGKGKSQALKAVSKVPLRYTGDVDTNLEDEFKKGNNLQPNVMGKIN